MCSVWEMSFISVWFHFIWFGLKWHRNFNYRQRGNLRQKTEKLSGDLAETAAGLLPPNWKCVFFIFFHECINSRPGETLSVINCFQSAGRSGAASESKL